jgi:hypothetical protein
VSDSTFMQVSNFFTYLNPILIYWIETKHPRLLRLTKSIVKIKHLKISIQSNYQMIQQLVVLNLGRVNHTDIRKTNKLLHISYINQYKS